MDAVFIRDVTGQSQGDVRYRALFAGAAATKFRLFRDPKDLPALDTFVHAHASGGGLND